MSNEKSETDAFYVLFVDDLFFEGSDNYDYLLQMAEKMKNSHIIRKFIRKIEINGYNRNQPHSKPYSYNPEI